jgi:tetratricopeptide (TPR) repeat protein
LLLLAGEAGVGKTRLAQVATQAALERGFIIATGRCYEPQQTVAYFPFVEALSRLYGDAPAPLRAALLTRWPHVSRVLGDLPQKERITQQSAPASGASGSAEDQLLTFRQISGLLHDLAELQPVALLLDDLHWADSATLDLLQHLTRYAGAARLLLLGTYRDADLPPAHPLAAALGDLAREHLLEQLTVRRLSPAETAQFVAAWFGLEPVSDEFSSALHARTEGNPFFIVEVLLDLIERGDIYQEDDRWHRQTFSEVILPESVRYVIHQRVGRLSAQGQGALQEASVLGQVFAVADLQGISESGSAEVDAALEEAEAAALVRATGPSTYAFQHVLIQQTLYHELRARRKQRLHLAAGEALERVSERERERRMAELAYHFARTDQWQKAVQYSRQAAERAHDAGARREEATLLAQALDAATASGDHALVTDLHEQRGHALIAAGLALEGVQELEAALGSLAADQVENQSERRIAILVELANGYLNAVSDIPDATQRARTIATEALAFAEDSGRDDLAARAMSALAFCDTEVGLIRESQPRFERAFARAGADRMASLLDGLDQYGLICYYLGAFAEADRHTRQALDIARSTHNPHITVRTLGNLGMTLTGCGRYDEALVTFAEARRLGQEFRTWHWLARAISMCAGLYLALGDHATAESVTAEAQQVNQLVHFPNVTASTGVDLLLTYARRHDPARAIGLLPDVEKAVAQSTPSHHWLLQMRFAQAQAEVALARGALEEALRHAQDGVAQARQCGRPKYAVLGRQTHAQALHALGRTTEAIAELRAAIERARPVGDPALFLRVAAALLAIEGDDRLLAETQATVERMAAVLPDDLRQVFLGSESARLVARLSP